MNSKAGIYIHIPFCRRRCNYCDFYLTTNLKAIDNFLISLKKEMSIMKDSYKNEVFDSIFIGGGTPSVLSSQQLHDILNSLNNNFTIDGNAEISVESNPEDFISEKNKLKEYKEIGINRLSLGVQSFLDKELKFLTREHTAEDSENVINYAQKYFENLSVDIIYSLPGQSSHDLQITLNKVCDLDIPHVSAYTLIFEEKTVLYNDFVKKKIIKNSDLLESELYFYLYDFLNKSNFNHYEVSNYSKPGYESVHNKKYWNYENYLGLGPSSHSFFSNKRWNNFRNLSKYNFSLENNILPIENEYILKTEEMNSEFIMLALRCPGVNFDKYKKLFGEDFVTKYSNEIKLLSDEGFGIIQDDRFKLTEKGFSMLDEIAARYF